MHSAAFEQSGGTTGRGLATRPLRRSGRKHALRLAELPPPRRSWFVEALSKRRAAPRVGRSPHWHLADRRDDSLRACFRSWRRPADKGSRRESPAGCATRVGARAQRRAGVSAGAASRRAVSVRVEKRREVRSAGGLVCDERRRWRCPTAALQSAGAATTLTARGSGRGANGAAFFRLADQAARAEMTAHRGADGQTHQRIATHGS
jgi:hypothetical protein